MMRLDEIDALLTEPDRTLREAMARINAAGRGRQFLVVVDATRRLLGALTDGDVRRALLGGKTLDAPVSACMNTHVTTGRAGQDAANAKLLAGQVAQLMFLPVTNESGRLVSILLPSLINAAPVTALVMAGGFGTRLGELTRDTPKPLLEVAGRPILDHVLQRIEDAGIEEIVVACHYQTARVRSFLAGRTNRARLRIIEESEPLGTAGAIGLIARGLTGPLLVMNADVLSDFDVAALIAFHRRHLHDGTLCVKQHVLRIEFGVVRHGDDGIFLGVDEKPSIKHFVLAGTNVLAPEICALVTEGERIDMPDLLNLARAAGMRLGLFPIHEAWIDVGRPADLDIARRTHAFPGSVKAEP